MHLGGGSFHDLYWLLKFCPINILHAHCHNHDGNSNQIVIMVIIFIMVSGNKSLVSILPL